MDTEKFCVTSLSGSRPSGMEIPKCSFLGIPANYYIGFADKDGIDNVRIVGAVCAQMVEKGLVNLLGKGSGELNWPVVLDLNKKVCYHSFEAHVMDISAVMGWKQQLCSKAVPIWTNSV
ncbi:MAG: hypothetical protein V7724_19985 [Sediminicola sp.]|tara:strand:- start:18624 stop:18980 length:357 start_codon:yes stop_codon:yes gene_type:complete